jgi:hypothetical protein
MFRMLLGIAGLTLLWFFCGTGSAQPKDVALPKGALPRSVTGDGQTVETAKKAAITKATDEIKHLMVKHQLTTFEPNEDYVRRYVLKGEGEAGDDVKIDNIPDAFKAWVVTFRTDTEWWHDIQRRDREAQRLRVAESRQHLGSQIILGLGLLLLAGVGYVRVDEYTQRRYTTWLRLGGLAIATTLAAGWWLFLQAPLQAPQ